MRANGSCECAPDDSLRRNPDAVIPGRCEASNPESRDSGSGPSDHPGMTASPHTTSSQHTTSHSRRDAPELCMNSSAQGGRGERRVPVAPAASCALCIGRTHTSIRVHRNHPAFPHAMVLTAYVALSPVTGLFCHRRQRIKFCLSPVGPTQLRELDASVGASGPHDFAVRISIVRLLAQVPLTGF